MCVVTNVEFYGYSVGVLKGKLGGERLSYSTAAGPEKIPLDPGADLGL